ncbi:hypothetical protein GOL24_27390 [Sinorhizobium medicae]|nr:hypothetical protein [Sinorhizobium medicae]MDX1231672.1 hypothetical protein [Sinorhizobium medicae]
MRPSPRNGARSRADLDLDKLPPQAGEVDCASARFSEIGYRHSVHSSVADTMHTSIVSATLKPNERFRSARPCFPELLCPGLSDWQERGDGLLIKIAATRARQNVPFSPKETDIASNVAPA